MLSLVYLWCYLEVSYMECELATLRAVQLIISLGFKVLPEKSVIIPTQTLEFLGFVLVSIRMIVILTSKKVDKILQLCQKFSHPNKQFTIREPGCIFSWDPSLKLPWRTVWPSSLSPD